MSSNSKRQIVTSRPTPNKKGTARVDLIKRNFDTVVDDKGYDVWIDKAVKCPCKTDGGDNLSSCKNCGGVGYIFIDRVKSRLVIQGLNSTTKYEGWSELNVGTVKITGRDVESLSIYDRITIIDAYSFGSEIPRIIDRGDKKILKTIYDIKEVSDIYMYEGDDVRLKRLEVGVDYTYSDNLIELSLDYNKIEDLRISIRYKFSPQYYIVDTPRESIVTRERNRKSGKNEDVLLPTYAIGRKGQYVLDELDLTGDSIFDNSSVGSSIVLSAPYDLIKTSVAISSASLSWSYDSDGVATKFEIQRSVDGGVFFSTIATQDIGDTTYTDSDISLTDGGYVYRIRAYVGDNKSVWSNQIALAAVNISTPSGHLYQKPVILENDNYVKIFDGDFADQHARGAYDLSNEPPNPLVRVELDLTQPTAELQFTTLKDNNELGNKNRFTAPDGTQTYRSPAPLIIDHLTGRMHRTLRTTPSLNLEDTLIWVESQNTAELDGYDDWRLLTVEEIIQVYFYDNDNNVVGYAPFLLPFAETFRLLNPAPSSLTTATMCATFGNGRLTTFVHGQNLNYGWLIRNHY